MQLASEALRIAQVVLGIGLVIFVHELGHFIAARMMGVRVVTFSLGFGPRLFGWRRGSTMYQIAAVPLGGFCRMAGEDRLGQDEPPLADELPAQGVGARFFIYSGGVLMNVAFALVVFPILFHFGMPFLSPVVGPPTPGSPAWHAGVPEGSRVLRVNGSRVLSFDHIGSSVALGDPDEALFLLQVPGEDTPREFRLDPEFQPGLGFNTVGVGPAADRDELGRIAISVTPDGPAWAAGLRDGDRIAGVVGSIEGLPLPDQIFEARSSGKAIELRVITPEEGQDGEASGGERIVAIDPNPITEGVDARVGIRPPLNQVAGIRPGPLFADLDLQEDDRLDSVNGYPVRRTGDLLFALRAGSEAGRALTIARSRNGETSVLEGPVLDEAGAHSFYRDLALTQDLETTALLPTAGEPAYLAGMRDDDAILEIDGTRVGEWADVRKLIRAAAKEERSVRFTVRRAAAAIEAGSGDGEGILEIELAPEVLPFPDYGFQLRADEYVFRADGPIDAIRVGAFCSMKSLEDTFLTLKRILLGQVDASAAVGGPIQISRLSYHFAGKGLATLFFFLCIISVNLAFINVLPVPVLDGGHLFFLIIEKIKGSPVSDRVLGFSQLIGVVLILSLMVYVTYNDLVRWLT